MSLESLPAPRAATDVLDDECIDLLTEPMAGAWTPHPRRSDVLRERLLDRITRSASASRAFITVRRKDSPSERLAEGIVQRTLYEAASRATRAGEPRRVRIMQLAAGATWQPDMAVDDDCEWLVMTGQVLLGRQALGPRDYHRNPAGEPGPLLFSSGGATVYMRQSSAVSSARTCADSPCTNLDATADWLDCGPGIRRRVMWTHAGQAALLYHALPGAQVSRHGHGHDEECLVLEGDVFLDDVLLRPGEYQLAPAGTQHQGVSTDTGLVLFAHGDLDVAIGAD